MTDRYANRESYRSVVSGEGLRYFRATVKETDLLIGVSELWENGDGASLRLEELALQAVKEARGFVER